MGCLGPPLSCGLLLPQLDVAPIVPAFSLRAAAPDTSRVHARLGSAVGRLAPPVLVGTRRRCLRSAASVGPPAAKRLGHNIIEMTRVRHSQCSTCRAIRF